MSRSLQLALVGALALPAFLAARDNPKLKYPESKKVDQVDEYHGNKVPDPYRWLEDANSAETKSWVEAQNGVTFAFLRGLPDREALKARLTELYNFERYSTPFSEGGRYFFSKNNGLQNQNVIYTAGKLGDQPTVLLDPNTLAADGTVSLSSYSISEDGKTMAYGVQTSGSDWIEWRVRDVATQKDLTDKIEYSKFSGASWTADGKGFFYSAYDKPDESSRLQKVNYFQKLWFHKVGTPQSQDVLVYERKDQKDWGFGGTVSDDGKFLVIRVSQGTSPKNRLFYRKLDGGPTAQPVVELMPEPDALYQFVGNEGDVLYFRTDKNAPRRRVIAVDTSKKGAAPVELIPEAKESLESVSFVGGKFICTYLKDAASVVLVFDSKGKRVGEVKLPGIGTATGFAGRANSTETFFSFTSFTAPASSYRYDLKTGAVTPVFQPKVKFNPADYVTEQVFYKSKDGTKVPMFISYKKGMKKDGKNPTYLYGYGGFNIAITPSFSVANLVWMEKGGIFAVANIRGGDEYGEEWHEAGTRMKKQNVFDDFIAAGEYLVAEKYTSKEHLGIGGGSNGGLLVGAVTNQRPDLFAAAVPAVGVMDMLRFQKFTIGWAWVSDYGSSEESPEMFNYLKSYSPLHNIKPGVKYPSVMVTTSDHDDRVVPAHSYKYAAALQAAQGGDAPVLIRIETKSGHGAGRPTSKIIEEAADRWAFLWNALAPQKPSVP
ncbi:MAG: S9 family peptidase [Verrucomicrobia bacterium]|nr:S9 family peptidase [Verrucomicrobiota bacterium]